MEVDRAPGAIPETLSPREFPEAFSPAEVSELQDIGNGATLTTMPGQDMHCAFLLCLPGEGGYLDTGTRNGTAIACVYSWCPLIPGHCGPIPGVKESLEAGDGPGSHGAPKLMGKHAWGIDTRKDKFKGLRQAPCPYGFFLVQMTGW